MAPRRSATLAELRYGGDVAVHRIDGFEGHQLGAPRFDPGQLAIEILGVVVAKDALVGPAVADAFDHRGVIARIGEHHAIGKARREGCRAWSSWRRSRK